MPSKTDGRTLQKALTADLRSGGTMDRSTRGLSAVLLIISGIALLTFVYAEIYMPTIDQPNYWENNTGGLVPLVLLGFVGDLLLASGLFLLVEHLLVRARRGITSGRVRLTAGAAFLAGVIWLVTSDRVLFRSIAPSRIADLALSIVPPLLGVIGIVGLYARYGNIQEPHTRRGTALLGVGLIIDIFATVLQESTRIVPVQTGALSYPVTVLEGVGILILATGAVLLGVALWRRSDVPHWISGLLVVGVGGYPLILVGRNFFDPMWYPGATIGLGVVWLGIGYHLWQSPTVNQSPE